MADLGCKANGNFADLSTWAIIHSGSIGWFNLSYFTYAPTTVAYSQGWAGDDTEVDGFYICLGQRNGTTGTVSFILRNTTDSTDAATVTINVSDVPVDQTYRQDPCWYFFKFSSPVTMTSGKNFAIGVVASNGSQIYVCRTNSTSNNWARALRTTTQPGSHAAGDHHWVAGEWTAAGTMTARTVTMNENSTTAYGNMNASMGGTVTYKYDADTQLRIGNLYAYSGGLFSIGTAANPIGASYNAILEFNCASNNQYAVYLYGSGKWETYGTKIRDHDRALLIADASAGTDTLTCDRETGWKNGDFVAIAGTDGVYTHHASYTLDEDASGNVVTLPSTLAYDKLGTWPAQCEVINMKKNITVRNQSASYVYAFYGWFAMQIDFNWTRFSQISTGSYNELQWRSYGSVSVQNCSFFNANLEGSNGYEDNFSFCDNVFYTPGYQAINISSTSAITSGEVRRNWVIGSGQSGLLLQSFDIDITDNRVANSYSLGFQIGQNAGSYVGTGEFDGNIAHDNSTLGFTLYACVNGRWGTNKAWHNESHGFYTYYQRNCKIDGIWAFGNSSQSSDNANWCIEADAIGLEIGELRLYGDSVKVPIYGLQRTDTAHVTMKVRKCHIYNHSTADIYLEDTSKIFQMTVLESYGFPTVNEGTEKFFGESGSFIKITSVDGRHKTWKEFGTVETDFDYYHASAPSQRLTPMSSTNMLESGRKLIPMEPGIELTVSVWVRKSSLAAGNADYGGANPRLLIKQNPLLDITGSGFPSEESSAGSIGGESYGFEQADLVLDAMTAELNVWEQLSGVIPGPSQHGVVELVVDCNGQTGFINVEDWSISES